MREKKAAEEEFFHCHIHMSRLKLFRNLLYFGFLYLATRLTFLKN